MNKRGIATTNKEKHTPITQPPGSNDKGTGNKNINKHTKWELGNFIATFVLAFIAVVGFIYTTISVNESAKILNNLNSALYSFVQPNLIFSDISWFAAPDLNGTKNIPAGINILFKNTSNIPIKIKTSKLRVFWNDTLIKKHPDPIINDCTGTIVAPGKDFGMTILEPLIFSKIYPKSKSMYRPPFLKIDYSATISDIRETSVYNIITINNVGYDIGNPGQVSITNLKTSITLIETRTR